METTGYIVRRKRDKRPILRREAYEAYTFVETPESLLIKARFYKTRQKAEAHCNNREEEVVKIKIGVIDEQ